ncbi:MAG: hypothetical protein AAGC93_12365 [Cyanobacteria bacterium P01_F01_bin.53]
MTLRSHSSFPSVNLDTVYRQLATSLPFSSKSRVHPTRQSWNFGAVILLLALVGCRGETVVRQCQQVQEAIAQNEISPSVDPRAAKLVQAQKTARLAATIKRMSQKELSAALKRCQATIGAECYQFRDALMGRAKIETERVAKAVRLEQAEEADRIAIALESLEITDPQLREQSNRLAKLYQSTGQAVLTESGFLLDDGTVQPASYQTHAQMAADREALQQEVQMQRDSMGIYCSMQ